MQWPRLEPRHAVTGLSLMIVLKRGYQAPNPSISRSEHEHHPPGPRKATLFCPGCGHESPVDFDSVVAYAFHRKPVADANIPAEK